MHEHCYQTVRIIFNLLFLVGNNLFRVLYFNRIPSTFVLHTVIKPVTVYLECPASQYCVPWFHTLILISVSHRIHSQLNLFGKLVFHILLDIVSLFCFIDSISIN